MRTVPSRIFWHRHGPSWPAPSSKNRRARAFQRWAFPACYAFLALAQCQKGTLSSGAGEEQAVNAIADVAEIGCMAVLELDGGAAGETDLTRSEERRVGKESRP